MIQTAFSNIEAEEDIPFVTVKELCEDETRFKVDSVYIKEGVVTKFRPQGQTVAYVKIFIDGTKFLVGVKQDVLLKCFTALKDARADNTDPYGKDAEYCIMIPEGKTYYNLYVDA